MARKSWMNWLSLTQTRCGAFRRHSVRRPLKSGCSAAGRSMVQIESLESRTLLTEVQIVKEIFPGDTGSNPQDMVVVGDRDYFFAKDPGNGWGLWESDGTAAGTGLYFTSDLDTTFVPDGLTNVNGTLFYSAAALNNPQGLSLWKTDPTTGFTAEVKDFSAGSIFNYVSEPVAFQGQLFFIADDGTSGRELWSSDGTTDGTHVVKGLDGKAGLSPKELTVVGQTLYFTADDGVSGRELWKTDGSELGTVMVADLTPGLNASYPQYLTDVNGQLYFTTLQGMWKYDGTSVAPTLISDQARFSNDYLIIGDEFYFSSSDLAHGDELWKSDGTPEGTVLVKDINAGSSSADPEGLFELNGKLYFFVFDGSTPSAMWSSDGTSDGTTFVTRADIYLGQYTHPVVLDGQGFFAGRAYVGNAIQSGFELIKTDGTATGTLVVDRFGSHLVDSKPQDLTILGDQILFSADHSDQGRELYRYAPNVAPVVADQTFQVPQVGTPNRVVGTVQATDTDTLFYQILGGNDAKQFAIDLFTGTITVASGATVDFNSTSSYTLQVLVSDNSSPQAMTTANVTITPLLHAVADTLRTDEDTAITANVITGTNGASADNFESPAMLTGVTQGAHGSVSFLSDGTVTYTPIADYNGNDSFTYTVNAGSLTETINVTLIIDAVSDISEDEFITSVNTPINANVITGTNGAHGTNFEGSAVLTSVAQGVHGVVTFLPDGTISYTPDMNFLGFDFFTYTLTSGGVTETAKANLFVKIGPHIVPDSLTGPEDTALTANLITGTHGASADQFDSSAFLFAVTQGAHGSVTFLPDGTITYVPNADYNGTDSFVYTVADAGKTENAIVTITITPVADIKVDSLMTPKGTSITANVITGTNGTQADNFEGTPVLTSVTQANHGVVTFLPDGTVTYAPAPDFFGTDFFTYTVTSGGVTETTTVNLTVNPVNQVVADSLAGNEDAAVTANLITGTNGASADRFDYPVTLTSVTQGAHGSVTFLPDGTITYVPNADCNGTDSFSYTVSFANQTETAAVSVTIAAIADIAADSLTTNEENSVSANLITGTNGASADNFEGVPVLTGVTQGANGGVTFLSDGTVTYTPNANFAGSDSFTYTVTSGGQTEMATVTVAVNAVTSPTITLNPADGTYHLGRKAALVDPTAQFNVGSVQAADFSNAKLTVDVISGKTNKTVLSVAPKNSKPGVINVDKHTISAGSTVIGTVSGGTRKSPQLVIEFNANATQTAVQALLKRISYQNKIDSHAATVQIQITDISGQATNVAIRQLNIVAPVSRHDRKHG